MKMKRKIKTNDNISEFNEEYQIAIEQFLTCLYANLSVNW